MTMRRSIKESIPFVMFASVIAWSTDVGLVMYLALVVFAIAYIVAHEVLVPDQWGFSIGNKIAVDFDNSHD